MCRTWVVVASSLWHVFCIHVCCIPWDVLCIDCNYLCIGIWIVQLDELSSLWCCLRKSLCYFCHAKHDPNAELQCLRRFWKQIRSSCTTFRDHDQCNRRNMSLGKVTVVVFLMSMFVSCMMWKRFTKLQLYCVTIASTWGFFGGFLGPTRLLCLWQLANH